VATGKEVRRFEGHRDHVWGIALAADGKTVAAYSYDPSREPRFGGVRVWDVATGKMLRHWPLPDDLAMWLFSPDLKHLITSCRNGGGPDGTKFWDVTTGKVIRYLPKLSHTVAFAPDGKSLFTVWRDFIYQLDMATEKELRRVTNPCPSAFSQQITLHPDGKTLLLTGSGSTVHFVDLATGKGLRSFEGHNRAVVAVAFSPDGKLVASAEHEELLVWNPTTQKPIRRITGHPSFVTALAFAANGKTLLSGSANHTAHRWDMASGREIKTLRTYGMAMALSPDGKIMATCNPHIGRGIWLWDVVTGKELLGLTDLPEDWHPESFDFSPESKTLAVGGGFSVRLWEVATGKELPPLGKVPRRITCVAYSPDGRLLAAVERYDKIHLWETATGRERLVVSAANNVTSIAFSPDGRRLALANRCWYHAADNKGRDKVALVDLSTGKEVHRFSGYHGGINCLVFSPDGKLLASGGDDTTTLLWDVAAVLPQERPLTLSAGELKGLWADLAGEDAAKAHRALWALTRAPAHSVPFLKDRVQPVPVADPQVVARLLAELGSERFAERQRAAEALDKMGMPARPALRKALEGKPALEVRRRIELLLQRPDGSSSPQALRAAEILEYAGTGEARRILEKLAEGAPEARLTISARASLERLARRAAAP
jgi:WD40 repeat protein